MKGTIMHQPFSFTSLTLLCSASSGTPQSFARYRLLHHLGTNGCLGEGGYGKVFACWDTHLRRVVVLKIARQYPSSLWVEYFTLLRLRGTLAVPAVHDLFEEQGHTCLVMEYLPGVTLDHWLESVVPGDLNVCLGIGEQVCRILRLLASHELTHNDIKPANLLMCGQQLVLLDFGMAHALSQSQSDGGTPGYLSPERLSCGIENAQSDLYSAGCVLAQAFDACVPHKPVARCDARWACLETLIEAMLHPDPRLRADWRCVQRALCFLQRVTSQQQCRRQWPLLWQWLRCQSIMRQAAQEMCQQVGAFLDAWQSDAELSQSQAPASRLWSKGVKGVLR
jgi:serine/threonine protein kinase